MHDQQKHPKYEKFWLGFDWAQNGSVNGEVIYIQEVSAQVWIQGTYTTHIQDIKLLSTKMVVSDT